MSASKNKSKSGIVTGTIIAIALTALMCGVYALLVKNGKLTDAYSEIIISASIALAVFIGALLSNPRQGEERRIWSCGRYHICICRCFRASSCVSD